ncbi:MAG: hypothetical protein ACI4BB_03960 [Coprococcus sp.]
MKNKKRIYKLTALLTAGTLIISMGVPQTVYAAEPNTPKEEVVYVNLDGDGSVSEINVVNIFDLSDTATITDYGHYESVRNMNTVDDVNYTDDTVTINASKGKLYYEGKMTDNRIPWNIDIHYYIDGKEYTADELAGKSGSLKITASIRENTSDQRGFFDSYALQTSITLDTKICQNITAKDATIANVGSDKQLTWTILPGKEADITITADVIDFETDGFAINAIPLSLNIEVDDAELMDQVTELLEAIEQLDDGAGELKDGVGELQNKVENELANGISELSDGAGQLQDGACELKDGSSSLKDGTGNVRDGAYELDAGITALNQGITAIQSGLDELNSQSDSLVEGSAEIKAVLIQLQSALNGVSAAGNDIEQLAAASSQIKNGIDQLNEGINTAAQTISYEAYKALIAENGGDIDALKQGNSDAIAMLSNLNSQLSALDNSFTVLKELLSHLSESQRDKVNAILAQAGISLDQIENLLAASDMLDSLITLLEANNACIDGTELYLNEASKGLQELASGAAELQENYDQFDTAIGQLASSLGDMTVQMAQLAYAINELVAAYGHLDDGINEYTNGVAQIVAGYSQISDGALQLADGSKALKNGTDTLYSGTAELLSGIIEFYDATGSLKDGAGQLNDGAAELLAGISQLYSGTEALKNGTGEMRNETDGMDTEISDKIDALIDEITGGSAETVSFVSDKNANIKAVQFVIQSESIKILETSEETAPEKEESGFIDKLVDLFR